MVDSERIQNPWMASEHTSIQMNLNANATQRFSSPSKSSLNNDKLGVAERAFSAAGAAVLSAVIVNPLDVAKVLFLLPSEFHDFISIYIFFLLFM
jgi:solute carrier family 25 protein 39/40